MGLLDDVLKRSDAQPPAAPRTVASDASRPSSSACSRGAAMSGGLAGLVNMFNQKGLGDVVSSWVSTGKNLPISPDQIQAVLGSSQVQALAAKAGINPQTASAAIAQILPQLVDKATPNGQLPPGGILDAISGFLRKS